MTTPPKFLGAASLLRRVALCFCAANLLAGLLTAQCANPTVASGQYTSGTYSWSDAYAVTASSFLVSGAAYVWFAAGNCISLTAGSGPNPGFDANARNATASTTFHAWLDTAPSVSGSTLTGGGSGYTFGWTASSPSGSNYIRDVYGIIDSQIIGNNGCRIWYNQDSNRLYLADDQGNFSSSGLVPEIDGAAWNSQCTIDAYFSWVQASGNQLTVNVYVWFTGLTGMQSQYVMAYDRANLNSEYQQTGFWNAVPGAISSPLLSIVSSHTSSFMQGQPGSYTLTVSNAAGAVSSSDTVTVTETIPSGLTLAKMSGDGWTCTTNIGSCIRGDALAPGSSYPVITVSVGVASNAPASVTNLATLSGGSAPTATVIDPTTVNPAPVLSMVSTHTGSFTQGQNGAASHGRQYGRRRHHGRNGDRN